MTEEQEKIIKAMAELGGYNRLVLYMHCTKQFTVWRDYADNMVYIPNYLNDHNAVQRVIDGRSSLGLNDYAYHLYNICGGGNNYFNATPRQKCEAILKAYDKWEEEV